MMPIHGHEDDGMEEMHCQAFDYWLPRNIGNDGSSISHIEQMDHIVDSNITSVGLSSDGFSTLTKKPHVPTMVSFW
jgi:hypothetical protein